MTPAPKRGSRSRPSTIALEESAGRRPRKRTRSTNSLPLSSEPPSVVLSTLNNRSRSLPRSNATKLLDRRVDGPPEDSKVPILSDRMAPDSTAVETQPLSSGALENLNGPPRPSLSGTRRKHNGHASDRDSESSLSDIGEDSEAETERLHNSPLKQRPKFVQHRKDSTSTTQAIAIEMPVRKEVLLDHGDTFADDAADDSTPSTPTQSSPSKKRKRDFQESPIVRPTEEPKTRPSTPPPKKKIHTPQVPSENGSVSTLEGKKPNSDDDENPAITNGVRQETPVAIVTNGKDIRPVKSIVKVATPAVEESDSNPDQDQESERAIGIEIEENTGVAVPIVPEEEHGDAVDTIGVDDEDLERALKKKAAMEELAEIERVFAHLKDRIYSEKLRRVEIEMKMIQDGTHPEYVAQKACIDQKLDEKERLADAQYKNGMESLEIATRVTKAQVHSQYYQRVRELRENTLNKCSELWYHIQRERRAGDTLVSEYTYRIPDRASTRIQHRKQYNWEVALLTGISKHIGFPAAPDVLGASEEERAEDLEAIGIAPRVPVRASATVQPPVLRDRLLDDHYERPQPIHWSQIQRHSPPSPAPQPVQAHSHPHVHIHHHHNRRHAAPGVSNQPDQPLFLKQRVPSATGSANPGHSQPSNVPLSALLQNDIKQEHSSPRPPSSLALSIHGGNNQNRSPQLVHNHPQSHPSQRPLQYNYSGHPMPSHPLQPPSHQHHSLYPRASSIESHPAPPPAPQRIIDLGSPATGERIYGREVEAPDGGLKRLKEESDGSLGIPTTAMRFPSRMSGF